MLSVARQGGFNPYPAKFGTVSVKTGQGSALVHWQGEIICGHNPWLSARKARVWSLEDDSEGVGWEDDERPRGLSLDD